MITKYSFSALFICFALLFTIGCSEEDDSVFVDPDLAPFFESFQAEANARGLDLSLSNLEIEGMFGNFDGSSRTLGQCRSGGGERSAIIIDRQLWTPLAPVERELVMFHELGHCALGRGHRDDVTEDGVCVSIMHSTFDGCINTFGTGTRAEFLDELFLNR